MSDIIYNVSLLHSVSNLIVGIEEAGDDGDPVPVCALGQLGLDVEGVLEARLQGRFQQLHGRVRHGVVTRSQILQIPNSNFTNLLNVDANGRLGE